MEGYSQASDLIKEMETTLSTKPGASIDTALRKLQSVLRNNVSTNCGRRGAALADYLVANGAPNLMNRLAGQALSSWEPRGLNRIIAAGAIEGPLALGAGIPVALKAAPALTTMSPRIMGEAVHGAARAARPISDAASVVPPALRRAAIRTSRQIGQQQNPYAGR
jgi:hypothetical protein